MNINIMQTKTITYDELLAAIPNNAQTYHHGRTFGDIANYIIENHGGSIVDYSEDSNTFDERQLSLIDNWDYSKVEPLYFTKLPEGVFRVRDGSHRCIIIAVQVKRGELVYQDIPVEITDYHNTDRDITNLESYLTDNWVPLYSDTTYTSNLRIKLFDSDVQNEDFEETITQITTQMQTVIDAQAEETRNRMRPVILKCHWHRGGSGKSHKSGWYTV